ncbi:hypothetical protein HPB47_019768 [Ixodes persulcatus]|uniref:Uncharacterized protein n=1 Tax=Ixodes persulcatus TaxID=34615 RepID=A0AC60QKR4_IXOPE|nr:hypothetical protein HPB47_019768 [Ixodes persulcatus]
MSAKEKANYEGLPESRNEAEGSLPSQLLPRRHRSRRGPRKKASQARRRHQGPAPFRLPVAASGPPNFADVWPRGPTSAPTKQGQRRQQGGSPEKPRRAGFA